MTLEEMQDAIAAKTKPPRETVMAMYGGKLPSIATLAHRENIARIKGQQRGGWSKRDTPHRTRHDACTAIARSTHADQMAAMSEARTLIITDLLKTAMTLKQICGITGIPT